MNTAQQVFEIATKHRPVIIQKLYWVGVDPVTGIMKASPDFHDILGHSLNNVHEVWAHSSEAAKLEYTALNKNIFEGVDPESELFVLIWLVQRGKFYFDLLSDPDFSAVAEHLNKIGVPHEVVMGNRMSLKLK